MNQKEACKKVEVEKEMTPMSELQMDLECYDELDPIESPACVIGRFFFVST